MQSLVIYMTLKAEPGKAIQSSFLISTYFKHTNVFTVINGSGYSVHNG